ncbi:MAG: hypothetical protein GTO40_26610, partial [Deltaproteobacteria bacterium]|nr:hypothetical protein [Deltaproteobacteria bacterium]
MPGRLLIPFEGKPLLYWYLQSGNGLIIAGSTHPLLTYAVGGFPSTMQAFETGDEFPSGMSTANFTVAASNNYTAIAQQVNFKEPLMFSQMNVLFPATFNVTAGFFTLYALNNLTGYNANHTLDRSASLGQVDFMEGQMSVNPDYQWGVVKFGQPVAIDPGSYYFILETNRTGQDWSLPRTSTGGHPTYHWRQENSNLTADIGDHWHAFSEPGDLIIRFTMGGTRRYDTWREVLMGNNAILHFARQVVHATTKAGFSYTSFVQ